MLTGAESIRTSRELCFPSCNFWRSPTTSSAYFIKKGLADDATRVMQDESVFGMGGTR